jgi:cardiolipin synthase
MFAWLQQFNWHDFVAWWHGFNWQDFFGWLVVFDTILEWAVRLIMLMIVPRRRSPAAAKGWLLLIFFFPWVGLFFFWLLGSRTLPRRYRDHHERLRTRLRDLRQRFENHRNIVHPDPGPPLSQAVNLAERLGGMPILGNNTAEFLADYQGAIDRLVADIESAQYHVHLLYYIFADDETGLRVLEALARAVRRGVVCRVLADAVGSRAHLPSLTRKMTEAGVPFHALLPVRLLRGRFDLRNHCKMAVIDGRVGYTGSQNLVNPEFKKGIEYDELVVRVAGPVVLELQAIFLGHWYGETEQLPEYLPWFHAPEAPGTAAAQALPSGPVYETENAQLLFVSLIHAARERLILTTPYFVPDESFLQAIKTAALRGVDVHLIVSRKADQFLVSQAQKSYYEELLEAGVHIHLYQPRFLHAKHLSVDDSVVLIGSSNMDIRSFALNAEISLLFYDTNVAGQLREHEQRYLANSEELSLDAWQQRPLQVQLLENCTRLLSPLL